MVYEDLLSMGISTRNVERYVRLVLEKLAEAKVGRLPKVTFAKDMFLEARGLAQIHVATKLLDSKENPLTLYSDGTSEHGHSYTTFDVQSGKEVFVVGLREVGGAYARGQLSLFKEVLEDVGGSLSKGNGNGNFTNLLFKSIKNLMSDCCATDKKFNNLFTKFRKELLPDVIKNWENLPTDQQKSLGNVIDIFCGLHFLVGLADQAEPYLKVWENINFMGQNVGSLLHESYSNGKLGTLRLLRTVCKSVQHHAYEKSGRMVTCEIFMEKRNITRLPIYQFLGNRFNILFLNGAGVYFLFDHLINFLIKLTTDCL